MAVRILPVVDYNGKKYYLDQNLYQLRNVDNPHDYVDMDDLSLGELAALSKQVRGKYPGGWKPMKAKRKNVGEDMLERAMRKIRE